MLWYKCKAELMTKECRDYNVRLGKPTECNFRAKYLVDYVPLCAKHAGVRALLIGTDRIQRI